MPDSTAGNFTRICFVCSVAPGDDIAWERVLQLSERMAARVDVIACVEEPAAGVMQLLASLGARSTDVAGEEETAAQVDRLLQSALARGVEAAGEVVRGSVFSAVVKRVQQQKHDLVVKGAQPASYMQQVLLGHIDRQLVRHCPCPVWIEKASPRKPRERLLAAVDATPYEEDLHVDTGRESLNVAILERAIAVAQAFDADLHVVHVWPFHLEGALQSRAGLTAEAVGEVGESIKRDHEQTLAKLLGPFHHRVRQVHLIKGNAGQEIARLAKDASIDAIIMGTVCRKGVAGFLIGNTAETVLDQADCSLLALKPAEFSLPESA